ncbi:hypothetical protein DFH29DRAFT_1004118 [Suillus ampliporus]|nr:hypothetical protein DFH29DRAFT_1004118 [Suillus ampliporus]
MQVHPITPPNSITHLSPAQSPNSPSLKRRHHTPESSDHTSGDSSEDELHDLRNLPRLPPMINNLSYCVKRAKTQFKTSQSQLYGLAPNTIELRFTDKSLGRGETDSMNLADVKEGKELFERGLRAMSAQTIAQAVVAKTATRESKRLRALTTAWEIEASIQHAKLLQMLLQQDTLQFVQSTADVSSYQTLWVERNNELQALLARSNLQQFNANVDFHVGAYSRDIATFTVVDLQLDQLESVAYDMCVPVEDAAVGM